MKAPLIEAVRIGAVREAWIPATIALPLVRVECGIAVVLEGVAVKLLGAAFGGEANLAGGRAAVLRALARREHLDFLDGLDVLGAEHRPRGARARRDGAIDRHEVLVGARAVDAEAPVGHTVRIERADGAAADAWLERREIDRVAAVERQFLN